MPSYGPNSPGSASSEAGTGTIDWLNHANIVSNNGQYASASVEFEATTYYLKGTNYGFSAIPDTDIIQSISVDVYVFASTDFTIFDTCNLIVAGSITGGAIGGVGAVPDVETARNFLFTTALPTTAQVKASNFGAAYQCNDSTEPADVFVDYMPISVSTVEGIIIASGGWALGGAHSLSHRLIMLGGMAYGGTSSLLLPAIEGTGGWAFGGLGEHFMYLPMRGGVVWSGGDVGPGATAIVMQGGMAWGRPAFSNGFMNRIKVTISPRATALYNFPLRVHMNFPTTAVRWEDLAGNKLTFKTAQFGPTYNGVVLVDIGTAAPTEIYLYWS